MLKVTRMYKRLRACRKWKNESPNSWSDAVAQKGGIAKTGRCRFRWSHSTSQLRRLLIQAWLNLTRRFCWSFVSVGYWCASRMGIQEGQLRIVRPLLLIISLVPLMFPRMKNLLRVWKRISLWFPVDTAIIEKAFCNTLLAVEWLFWTSLHSICRRQSDSRSTYLIFVRWFVMIRC